MIYKRFYLVVVAYLAGIILFALAFAFSFARDLTYSIFPIFLSLPDHQRDLQSCEHNQHPCRSG